MNSLMSLMPAAVFFIAFFASDKNLLVATAAIIPALFVEAGWRWYSEREFPKLQFALAGLVLVLGGITLALRDPIYIKIKPTVVYSIFGLIILGSRFIGDKPILQRIPQKLFAFPDHVWAQLHINWGLFFFGIAALNVVMFTQFDEATWVTFKTFGYSGLMIIFMFCHWPYIGPYLVEQKSESTNEQG